MRLLSVLFAVCCAACSTERVEIIHEMVGCEADRACDDRDDETLDYCAADSGFCNHERVVIGGLCESAADCDDDDAASADTCDTEGVCHHTVDVTAPFDPRTRQDIRSICEQPTVACGSPSLAYLYVTCGGDRQPWFERGYVLWITLGASPTGVREVHIRPQLRAGDPDDLFRVRAEVGYDLEHPVLVRDMTGVELERDGITVSVRALPDYPELNTIQLWIDFADPVHYASRVMQWALPPGGVTDLETGADLNPCLQVGPFVDVPEHGILRLGDGSLGEPECQGTVRAVDVEDPSAWGMGLVREQSDPTLYYVASLVSPQRILSFPTRRELQDWFGHDFSTFLAPGHMCAGVGVVPDGALDALVGYEREDVGINPGMRVQWYDPAARRTRYGIADRRFTIREIVDATDPYTLAPMDVPCTLYYPGAALGPAECTLDVAPIVYRYTVVPTALEDVDPLALYRGGYLFFYNRDLP